MVLRRLDGGEEAFIIRIGNVTVKSRDRPEGGNGGRVPGIELFETRQMDA